MLKITISDLYKQHRFLLQSDKIEEEEKQMFEQILYRKAENSDCKFSLKNLSENLRKHFNKKVIILVSTNAKY